MTATINHPPEAPARTILYIEDDESSRRVVERALRAAGYRVLVATRGLEGLDIARREMPDLILTDINLPDLSGREVATMLRGETRFRRTPIVALTAQVFREQRELSAAAGLTGYMIKPVDIDQLPKQVEFFLRGGQDLVDKTALAQAQARYAQEVVTRLEGRIRELEGVNADLSRLDKMKDSFIQITAHELRTPLTLVYGYSRLMNDNPFLSELVKADAGTRMVMDGMVHAIGRMQSIINEILVVSRIMTNQITLSLGVTDLGEIMVRILDDYADVLRDRRLSIFFDREQFPNAMRADWELMELLLKNIVSNAIKYTPDGGSITITARITGNQDTLRLMIQDTGIGIAPDEITRIFESFHTTSDPLLHSTSKTAFRGGGIGLGLAVCKGIVEAHGGRIWAESLGHDPDRLPGSNFVVVMPLYGMSGSAEPAPWLGQS